MYILNLVCTFGAKKKLTNPITTYKIMKLRKTILFSILTGFAFTCIHSQEKKFSFFGSYAYGIGNLTASVNSSLGYPYKDEVNKLRSGSTNQIEAGVYYHAFGLGIIHNAYATNASTGFENVDINGDALLENGTLGDKLNVNFTALELLYKIPVFRSKFDVTWKIGLGNQSYSINKDINMGTAYWDNNNYTLTGNLITSMAGVEINYRLWKIVGIGVETSIIPGNYTKLKNKASPSDTYEDNVTRLSSGLKITITI